MKWEFLLVAAEVCTAFALGIVGATLADRLSLPAEVLATAAAVLLLISVVVRPFDARLSRRSSGTVLNLTDTTGTLVLRQSPPTSR